MKHSSLANLLTVGLYVSPKSREPEHWLNDCIDWTAKDIADLKKKNAEMTIEVDLKKLGLPNGSLLRTYVVNNSDEERIAINTKDDKIVEAQYRVHYFDIHRFQNDINSIMNMIQSHNAYLKPAASTTDSANPHQTYTALINDIFEMTISIYVNNPGTADLGFILLGVTRKK